MAWGEEFLDRLFHYTAVPITIGAFAVCILALIVLVVTLCWVAANGLLTL